MKKPTIFCIVSLMHGDGGKYVATNLAYFLKKNANKKEDVKVALVNANKYDDSLAYNLEEKTLNELTTQLKFDIKKYKIDEKTDFEALKKEILNEFDFIVISAEIETFGMIDKLCKNRTNILVFKGNGVNNRKIESNIEMIKENFKYAVVNCPEKTVKVTKVLKENNVQIVGRVIYNELTLDNVNISKATKLKKIKYLKNFKRIALIKIRKKEEN